MPESPASHLYIGLMSGTSLDGVDGLLAECSPEGTMRALGAAYRPFAASLREELLRLQTAGHDEIHREALCANALARVYADCVSDLLSKADLSPGRILAIGAHGQTIRHRPEAGYTRQTNNPALLAELTGIGVVADFRSRDVAAAGQGAPLVPAFHQAVFGHDGEVRVVANIGGIANISILDPACGVNGFDTGPGNVLMDLWVSRHRATAYDRDGAWAAAGREMPDLLADLMAEPYLFLPPPKSTGRDLFHLEWLADRLRRYAHADPVDVQATLAAFTAESMSDAVVRHAPAAAAVYVCGGGAYNAHLMLRLQQALHRRASSARVLSTDALGIPPHHVEAFAFAWLAHRHMTGQSGNLPAVTGANGARILGAHYPA